MQVQQCLSVIYLLTYTFLSYLKLNYETCVEIILTDIKCKLCTLDVYENIAYCEVLSYIHSISGTKDRRSPSAENIQIQDKLHQNRTVSVFADCILEPV